MNEAKKNSMAVVWIPAAFCGALSIMKLSLSGAGDPVFYSFLPMCFVYVALHQLAMHKRIESLEAELHKERSQTTGSTAG